MNEPEIVVNIPKGKPWVLKTQKTFFKNFKQQFTTDAAKDCNCTGHIIIVWVDNQRKITFEVFARK